MTQRPRRLAIRYLVIFAVWTGILRFGGPVLTGLLADRLDRRGMGSPAATGLAVQWAVALTFATALLHLYRHTLGAMLSVVLRAVVLGLAIGLLVASSLGWLLREYGFQNLFWGLGDSQGNVVVPFASASMTVLTLGILWLHLYYIYTSRFEAALEPVAPGTGLRADIGVPPIDREGQQRTRARHLWGRIAQDGWVAADQGDPGLFTLLATLPLVGLLALPGLPVFTVTALGEATTSAAWLAGLALGVGVLLALRWWLARAEEVLWDRMLVRPGPERAMVPERTLIGPSVLTLFSVPLIMCLTAAYMGDQVYGPGGAGGDLLHWVVLAGAELLGAAVLAGLWVRRLRGPMAWRVATYTLIGVAIAASYLLARVVSGTHGLASTYSLCCLLIFVGYLVVLLSSETPLFRSQFRVQVLMLGFFAVLLWLNGVNQYKLQYDQIPGYPSWPWSPPESLVSLYEYDLWLKDSSTGVAQPKPAFGSPFPVDDRVALSRWLKRAQASGQGAPSDLPGPQGDPRPKLVVVATSGGALRAAIWTAHVLGQIEQAVPEFPARLRLVTGASGGMLGGAAYVADLGEPPRGEGSPWPRSMKTGAPGTASLARRLKDDFWSPALHWLVFGDFTTLWYPGPVGIDRGTVMEESWREKFPQLGRTFPDLLWGRGAPLQRGWTYPREGDGALPSLVFTPMLVEDSRRLFISNLKLRDLVLNHGRFEPVSGADLYTTADKTFPYYSQMGVEMFSLLPRSYGDGTPAALPGGDGLRLSSAVRMSATFPLISPAVSLPTRPARSIVDAGYYDNYGVDLAVSWLERHRLWLERNTSGVALIQIRAFTNEESLRRLDREPGPQDALWKFLTEWVWNPVARGAGFVTTPLSGVARARQLVMSYRNDNAVAGLKRRFTMDMLEREAKVSPALSYTTEDTTSYTEEQAEALRGAYERASKFFRIFTFTCGDESADRPAEEADRDARENAPGRGGVRLAEVETMNWMVSEREFDQILSKWRTQDNQDRFKGLLGFFGRDPAPRR